MCSFKKWVYDPFKFRSDSEVYVANNVVNPVRNVAKNIETMSHYHSPAHRYVGMYDLKPLIANIFLFLIVFKIVANRTLFYRVFFINFFLFFHINFYYYKNTY